MNDEAGTSGTESANEPSAADAVQDAMANMMAGMSTAERVIALGAALYLVLNATIGDVILDDYGVSGVWLLLTAGALVAILRRGKSSSPWQPLYPWLLEASAAGFALIGVYDFADWLLDGFDGLEGSLVFYSLVEWAVIGLMGYGAYLLHKSHD